MNQHDVNPILRDDQQLLFDLAAHRPSRSNTTIVWLADGLPIATTAPGLRERLRHRYWCYEIDMAQHTHRYEFGLPSAEEAFRFRVTMYLTWAVHDPANVARFGIRDVHMIIWPFVGQRLRALSRRFGIEDSALAEAEINNDLKAAPFNLDSGIVICSCSVHLRLDDRATQHLAARAEARRAREREVAEHDLQLLREQHEDTEARLRHQLEQQNAAHQLALKRQRIDFYHQALEHEGVSFFVLQLIEHPEDIAAAMAMLEQRNDDVFSKAREVIKDLSGRDMYNPADLDPIREKALLRLWNVLDTGETLSLRQGGDGDEGNPPYPPGK